MIMDFHHHSLLAEEQRQAREDSQPQLPKPHSFYVITDLWEEWAESADELKELLLSAYAGNLKATIDIVPF